MFRKISFGIFIVACIAGGVWWFIYVKEIKAPVSEGINAIPTNAAIIFESKQAKNVWKKLSQTNIMWEELVGTETFSKLNANTKYIDSLISLTPDVEELMDNHSVFISAHVSIDNTFNYLYVYSLPNVTHQSTLDEFLKTTNNKTLPTYTDYVGVNIGTIHPKDKSQIYFAFLNGTLMMSAKQSLVEDAIRQLKSGVSLAKDKYFSKVISTAGKNVDANIYINYKNFPKLLNRFTSSDNKNEVNALSNFADCSGWDMTIKPNALRLNGFTQANDSTNTFLNIFSNQKPKETELAKILPSRTALFLSFGISNIKTFNQDYKKYLNRKHKLSLHDAFVKDINSKYDVNIENEMQSWITNEMAYVVYEPNSAEYADNVYAVFHSGNTSKAESALTNVAKTIWKAEKEKPDTSSFRNHKLINLGLPEVIPQLFGWQFSKIHASYFTSIDKYIVFANSPEALKRMINDFENNKTLFNNNNYKAYSENISTESNIYLYSAIARSSELYSSFLNDDMGKEIRNKLSSFKKFEAVGIQFTASNNSFYSNIYLKFNPEQKQESNTLWETKLDTTISTKPYLVINHNTNGKEVFVQDDANKIYLISNTGKIIWTKQLPEKIMGEVIQVDALKNKKLQMLFNTHSYIYLFDRNGNDMKGFPIKLKSGATNAVSVADYDNTKDYRIFIATENNRILCYKTDGTQVDGFKFDKTINPVFLPVQYFNSGGKDNLCAVDNKGKIYIIDRHGDMKTKLKEQFTQGISTFYIETNKDFSKTAILAADTLGRVMKFSFNEKKEIIKLQDFETSPYFDFKDMNNDDKKEFVFLTRNALKIFAPDKSLLFNYDFNDTLTQAPMFFLYPDWTANIGVVSERHNKMYLFDDNGMLIDGFPLTGKTAFAIGDLNNEGTYNLVCGSADNSIYVYQIRR